MSLDRDPTVAEALDAAQTVAKMNRLHGWLAFFTIVVCLAMAFYEPWSLAALVAFLMGLGGFNAASCWPEKTILCDFAKKRNWFYEPEQELLYVEGYERRRRFYTDPKLFSISVIMGKLRLGDFNPHPAPPTGEVPRKIPSRSRPRGTERLPDKNEREEKSEGGRVKITPKNTRELTTSLAVEGIREDPDQNFKPQKIRGAHLRRLAAEKERLAEEEKERAAAEMLRLDEERRHAEEEKRLTEQARQRAEEEQRRVEQARRRAEDKKRRDEELQRRLEEPRFAIHIDDGWTDLLSVKAILRIMEDGRISLSSLAREKGSHESKPLDQFPDLAALFMELIVANKEKERKEHSRDRNEKESCTKFHGTTCAICGFSFKKEFGEIGEGYIEVHHLKPIADYGNSAVRIVNPVSDLRPVCANCHRMLHRRTPPYSIEEMIEVRLKARKWYDLRQLLADRFRI